MKTTPRIGLKQPDEREIYSIDVFNENSEIIDSNFEEVYDALDNLSPQHIEEMQRQIDNLIQDRYWQYL